MMTQQELLKKAKVSQKRILIVDDHPLVRQGLRQMVENESDLTICGEADNVQEALSEVDRLKPDLLIVDISLKGRSGIELIKTVRVKYQNLPILVLSMHDESLYADRILRAGAQGYIMKGEATEQVIAAIRNVLQGKVYLSDKMTAKILSGLSKTTSQTIESPLTLLSNRELEVFQYIGRGQSTREIAKILNLSIKTIETYRAHIMEKLNFKNAVELVQQATHWVQEEGVL